MADIKSIIQAIDDYLNKKHQVSTTPVEINPYLESLGLLNDTPARPGKPIRDLLRKGKIPHAYQIGVNWVIPKSNYTSDIDIKFSELGNIVPNQDFAVGEGSNINKLQPIAEFITKELSRKHNKSPVVHFEYSPSWLLSYPSTALVSKFPVIKDVYGALVNREYALEDRLNQVSSSKMLQKQRFDIWIGEPFNFAIEFDEKQHFNQFRLETLKYYNNIPTSYPIELYVELNSDKIVKPNISGFTKLKSNDPLFPELLLGEKQDNRSRQRAFRDFLKDLYPISLGLGKTLRIPYQITNKNIADFSDADISAVAYYIKKYNLL